MQVVILAGGLGTRLRAVTGDTPKALVEINGRPLLDHVLSQVTQAGFGNVLLLTGHGGDRIEEYCGDGSKWGLNLRCVRETAPAGTAGAVLRAERFLESRFMVLYGDIVFDFDLRRMAAFHQGHSADGTLFVHPNDHPYDSDLVDVDSEGRVLGFHSCPHAPEADLPNLVNAGVYILERSTLFGLDHLPSAPDFGKHVLPQILHRGGCLMGYRSREYIRDVGTPERLARAAQDLKSGLVTSRSLARSAAAVFLDRDGTLIEESGYVRHPQQVVLMPGAASALARLNANEYRTVLVTNQAVIARGECDEEGIRRIHNRLEMLLGAEGAYLDALYYCPHHPDGGYSGERAELKRDCECRKPKIGLMQQAERDLNLKLSESWLVGDGTADILAGRRAGLRSILVKTGQRGLDGKYLCSPDFECTSIVEAVDLILEHAAGNVSETGHQSRIDGDDLESTHHEYESALDSPEAARR